MPLKHKAVTSCPKEVVSLLAVACEKTEGGNSGQTELRDLWVRICCRAEMEPVWAALASPINPEIGFAAIAMTVGKYCSPDHMPFLNKTDTERMAWIAATQKAASKLQQLLREGPGLDAERLLEAMPMEGLRWFLGGLGVKVVPGDISSAAFDQTERKWLVTEWTVKRMQQGTDGRTEPLSLDELLAKLLDELAAGVPSTQTISKPRDVKAYRARYILGMTNNLQAAGFRLTDELVATIARVVLEDDSITAAIANKFRYRQGRDVPVRLEIQDFDRSDENVG